MYVKVGKREKVEGWRPGKVIMVKQSSPLHSVSVDSFLFLGLELPSHKKFNRLITVSLKSLSSRETKTDSD